MRLKLLLLTAVIVIVTAGLSHADDFYKGKTIRVIVGGSAGGGFDIYTRTMARHMGKHIPGNVVLQVTAKKIPSLPNVPMALDLAKTDEARQLLKAGATGEEVKKIVDDLFRLSPATKKKLAEILAPK